MQRRKRRNKPGRYMQADIGRERRSEKCQKDFVIINFRIVRDYCFECCMALAQRNILCVVVLSDNDAAFIYWNYIVQNRIQNIYKIIILGLSPNGKAQHFDCCIGCSIQPSPVAHGRQKKHLYWKMRRL